MTWKPGESGNPNGRPIEKPFRDALRMEVAALANGERIKHPVGSLRWNAQRLLISGGVPAQTMIADRLDGKVPQAIVGDKDHPGLLGNPDQWFGWLKTIHQIATEQVVTHDASTGAQQAQIPHRINGGANDSNGFDSEDHG